MYHISRFCSIHQRSEAKDQSKNRCYKLVLAVLLIGYANPNFHLLPLNIILHILTNNSCFAQSQIHNLNRNRLQDQHAYKRNNINLHKCHFTYNGVNIYVTNTLMQEKELTVRWASTARQEDRWRSAPIAYSSCAPRFLLWKHTLSNKASSDSKVYNWRNDSVDGSKMACE